MVFFLKDQSRSSKNQVRASDFSGDAHTTSKALGTRLFGAKFFLPMRVAFYRGVSLGTKWLASHLSRHIEICRGKMSSELKRKQDGNDEDQVGMKKKTRPDQSKMW